MNKEKIKQNAERTIYFLKGIGVINEDEFIEIIDEMGKQLKEEKKHDRSN